MPRRTSPRADVLLMAAAVADFRPADAGRRPSSRRTRARNSIVALERTPDILSGLAAIRRPDQTRRRLRRRARRAAPLAYGRDKLARKGLDAIVVNDIARAGHRLRRVRQRGHDRHRRRRAPRPARVEGRGRTRDPRGGRRPAQCGEDYGMRRALAMSMESIGEEPGPVGEDEIASAQQLGRQVALAITDAVEVRRDLLDLVLVCVGGRGPHPHRGPARAWARRRWRARSRAPSTCSSRACSARPTCCPPTWSAPTSSTSARTASSSAPGRSSPTSSSSTRSTAPRPRRSRACSSACRSAASPSTCTPTSWRARSSSWPRRTRSSSRAPTRCPRRRSTASWRACRWAIRRRPARSPCSAPTRSATASTCSSRWPPPPSCWPSRTPRAACTPPTRCAATSSRCCTARARTRASSSAPARAPA